MVKRINTDGNYGKIMGKGGTYRGEYRKRDPNRWRKGRPFTEEGPSRFLDLLLPRLPTRNISILYSCRIRFQKDAGRPTWPKTLLEHLSSLFPPATSRPNSHALHWIVDNVTTYTSSNKRLPRVPPVTPNCLRPAPPSHLLPVHFFLFLVLLLVLFLSFFFHPRRQAPLPRQAARFPRAGPPGG